jgi:hypothetical protein
VFVLVEPGIEQKGLELHASTSKGKLVLLLILRGGAGMFFHGSGRWGHVPTRLLFSVRK